MDGMDGTATVEFRDPGDGTTEMIQSEASLAYVTGDHMDRPIGGTIEVHKGLATFISSKSGA